MLTDETKIELSPFTRGSIRLTKENITKLKNGSVDIYELISGQESRFELSIMIAGGICRYGLSNLIFYSGTQNNFSYKQFLLFMKKDISKKK